MKPIRAILLAIPFLTCWGCSLCSSPYDDHYPAYGGAWERDTANQHRVGSAFADAGRPVKTELADADSPAAASEAEDGQDLAPPSIPSEE